MKSFLIFVSGIVVGAGASYLILKNKNEEEINEAYREAREYRKNRDEVAKEDGFEDPINLTKETVYADNEEVAEIEHIISNNRYTSVDGRKKNDPNRMQPFVISPEEFGMDDDIEVDTLYYYKATTDGANLDDIIVDEYNDEIHDVEDLLGMSISDVVSHYGEYEEGSVYIRNPKLNIDYEIVREIAYYEPN